MDEQERNEKMRELDRKIHQERISNSIDMEQYLQYQIPIIEMNILAQLDIANYQILELNGYDPEYRSERRELYDELREKILEFCSI